METALLLFYNKIRKMGILYDFKDYNFKKILLQ